MIIHGGFWKERWHVNNAAHTTIAPSLARPVSEQPASSPLSYVAVEVEYRRREADGGGYPGTNNDVAEALKLLPLLRERHNIPMDLARLALLGHSAGGQLALWAGEEACRRRAAAGGASVSMPVPRLVVAVAPVTDLEMGHEMKLSDEGDAIPLYMRCLPDSEENIAKYRAASPQVGACVAVRPNWPLTTDNCGQWQLEPWSTTNDPNPCTVLLPIPPTPPHPTPLRSARCPARCR